MLNICSLCVCARVQGQICVSPQCFHVLTHMLMSLAEGRLVLALEVKHVFDSKRNYMNKLNTTLMHHIDSHQSEGADICDLFIPVFSRYHMLQS